MTSSVGAWVDFIGEIYPIGTGSTLTIGREGDVTIDDNPFLHRQFLQVHESNAMYWITNIGSQLSATLSDGAGLMQAWLAPGASLPLVFSATTVWFTAGPITYEFEIHIDEPPFSPVQVPQTEHGSTTIGRATLTPDQKLLILALAENVLQRGERGAGSIPSSREAAERLGWTITKFNRKLDNVADKLSKLGIRGLHGEPGKLASSRRSRLVEYALAARLIDQADLPLLDLLQA